MAATLIAQHMYAYQDQELGQRTPLSLADDGSGVTSLTNAVVYWDINGNLQIIFTPATGAMGLRAVDSRDWMYFIDNEQADLLKWNIADGLSSWGIGAPNVAPAVSSPISAGAITLTTGRVYFVVYFNNVSQSYSDLSPASAITGPLTAENEELTDIPVSTNPQVTSKLILATADGGDPTTLYELAIIPNAQTSYLDATPEATLLAATIWQDTDSSGNTHGVFGNFPPPVGAMYPTTHNGRIWLTTGEILLFSKSLDDVTTSSGVIAGRYEEAWPPSNAINVAVGAEEIHGLLSDGQTLYIGTESHIFRVTGDSPSNFSEPEIVFPQTGLLNQDVWQLVYLEGTPVGTMWLTPDLRVMGSDFNTYDDVGTPVQDTLNNINLAATYPAWAVMVSNGPYNFYILAVPTGSNNSPDTFLVFDMRLRKWYTWNFADNFVSGIFYTTLSGIPRWIFTDATGTVRLIDPTMVEDRATDAAPVPITSTIQTSWLDMGDDRLRKSLNECEVLTVDPNIEVTIWGATTTLEFSAPNSELVANQVPIQNFLGDYKVFLTGTQSIDRNYRYKFVSTSTSTSSTSDTILSAFAVEARPLHRL